MTTNLAGKMVLVTGATGQQGGATARHLLARGAAVRALVRDPTSPAARRLANAGAELVVGDMDDVGTLRRAMHGVHGAFSVQPARIPPSFAENELERGLNVAEAAHAVGLTHLVYSSVAGADRSTGIPHWEIKGQIERRVRSLGLPFTILRQTLFMDMYADATYGLTGELSLVRSLPPNAIVQHVAIDDIAAFTGLALGDPSRYLGKTLEVAGDELTVAQVLAAIGRTTDRRDLREWIRKTSINESSEGRPVRYAGWHADIASLRALHPGLMTFADWLVKGGAARIDRMLDRSAHDKAQEESPRQGEVVERLHGDPVGPRRRPPGLG
jgi:uncharacterized protein YbjT (DUF2867 family)